MVKLRKVDDKTTGGLFVPTADVEKPKEGTVVLAGPGKHHATTGSMVECPVKVGDLVLLSDYAGEKVDYNGEQHVRAPPRRVSRVPRAKRTFDTHRMFVILWRRQIFCDADRLLGFFEGQSLDSATFKPLGDLVMVATADQETETSTGIALAGLDEEEGNSGAVVAVGPGKCADSGQLLPPSVAVGDSVMYVRRAGCEVTVADKQFVVVSESQCLAKW